jgi:hypothetical protein
MIERNVRHEWLRLPVPDNLLLLRRRQLLLIAIRFLESDDVDDGEEKDSFGDDDISRSLA